MYTWCKPVDSTFVLSDELRKLVEARMSRTLSGIEETLKCILEKQEISLEALKRDVQSLEQSFNMLSQKWNLEILYTLFLRNATTFSQLKKILGVNSRTLSDKLKNLRRHDYVKRMATTEPVLKVEYVLTVRGRETVLLALPLLYYVGKSDQVWSC